MSVAVGPRRRRRARRRPAPRRRPRRARPGARPEPAHPRGVPALPQGRRRRPGAHADLLLAGGAARRRRGQLPLLPQGGDAGLLAGHPPPGGRAPGCRCARAVPRRAAAARGPRGDTRVAPAPAPAPAAASGPGIGGGEGFENTHDAMDCAGCHDKPADQLKRGDAVPPRFAAQGVDAFCRSCHGAVDKSHFPLGNAPRRGHDLSELPPHARPLAALPLAARRLPGGHRRVDRLQPARGEDLLPRLPPGHPAGRGAALLPLSRQLNCASASAATTGSSTIPSGSSPRRRPGRWTSRGSRSRARPSPA